MGAFFEGDAEVELAEGLGEFEVGLVVAEPEGDLGDAGGEFLDFDAVHLVDVDEGEAVDVVEAHFELDALAPGVEFGEDVEFEAAEFAVGDDEEVAAAAGGVEEAEGGDVFLQGFEAFVAGDAEGADVVELGAEVVEEEGADEFEDVGLVGVVGADLASFAGFHDALEEGAEDGGGDAFPVEGAGVEEGAAHVGVEVGEVDAFREEVSVDVGEVAEVVVEVGLALGLGGVEDGEEAVELGAEVGAVGGGAVADVEFEGVGGEDAGVVGEEAEEEAGEEEAEVVTGVAAGGEGVVEFGHEFGGADVGGVLGVEFVLFVAGDEGEVADVSVEVGEGEDVGFAVFVEVVEGDALEVGDNEVAGEVDHASGGGEAADVGHSLGLGLVEVGSGGFVFDEEGAGPEEVDGAPVAGEFADGLLVTGDGAAVDAEDVEELVPEGLSFGGLAGFALPGVGEAECALSDFVPGEGHGRVVAGSG